MRMRKKKGWALFLTAALLTGILSAGNLPVSKAEETSASAGKYGLKNPVVKAVSPPENTSHGLSNPRNEDGTVTWDCVYFGNYWQNDTNGDGVADKDDEKQPIKWRVLSVDGDDAFLLADTNLDVQRYNDTNEDVTWETCTMRSWLNDTFLNNMFTKSEQEMIKVTNVINEDNPKYSIEGGNDTQDKIYLLSFREVMNPKYGFASTSGGIETRKTVNTAYVNSKWENKSEGMETLRSIDDWWLRSLGGYVYNAPDVMYYGCVCTGGYFPYSVANKYSMAVRPVLHLNLSSNSEWKKAGTVSSVGGEMTATWDCIYFGNYRQGYAGWQMWKEEPIKWRVLSVDGDDALLLADTNLDVQQYNDPMSEVTWETCTMRTWLNNAFLNTAFTVAEQEAIKVTDVINKDNPHGIVEGNDTQDKVYLLSLSEVTNPQYGFDPAEYSTNTRNAENTAYVTAGGEMKGGNMVGSTMSGSEWWLRSSGYGMYTPIVDSSGAVNKAGRFVNSGIISVRPALHLNLSDTSVWSYAGTVSSTKEEEETDQTPSDSPASTKKPDATLDSSVTPVPSATTSPSAGGSSVVGIPSIGQNPAVVTSSAPAQHTPMVEQEEVQKTDEKVTPAKVTGLKLKAKKKAIEASWKKVSEATGYEIQVSTSKKFTKKSTKTTKKTKLTIGKLKSKTKYFVRVRAYHVANGKKTYGKWSNIMNIKTKK